MKKKSPARFFFFFVDQLRDDGGLDCHGGNGDGKSL